MPTHTFLARSHIPVTAEELFAWHARSGALERLIPPWEPVEVVEKIGEGLRVGTRVTAAIHVGPAKFKWIAEHTAYEEGRLFQDRQVKGPFSEFVQTHRMLPEDSGARLEDEIQWQLPATLRAGASSAQKRIERMFRYRHEVTRLDLTRHARYAAKPRMTIAVSGASGLIGSTLALYLQLAGHTVKKLVRNSARSTDEIRWDPEAGVDLTSLEGIDAVVHLAGAPVAQRWNAKVKQQIHDSRVKGTQTLASALSRLRRKPRVFICASAVGFYGDRGDELLEETSAPGKDFLADVCRGWEAATRPAEEAGIRTVQLRTGVVLSGSEGALAKMLPPFFVGAGGPLGSGRQWMSWISLEDVLGIVEFALHEESFSGACNVTAPEPIRQGDFARILGHVLHRPSVMPTPRLALKLALGEMGQATVLASQRAVPKRLIDAGFSFVHADLECALRFHLGRSAPSEMQVERR